MRFRLLLCLLLACGAHAQSTTVSDDFDDGDDEGWLRYDPIATSLGQQPGGNGSTWRVTDGAYQLTAVPSPSSQLGPGRLGALQPRAFHIDFCLQADLRPGWDARPNLALGLLARIQPGFAGAGTLNGYALTYQTRFQDLQLSLVRGEVPTGLTPATPVALDPTRAYRFVLIGSGPRLVGRVYAAEDLLHPIASTSGTSADFSAGIAGLVVYDNGGGQGALGTFDNFHAAPLIPPPLQISRLAPSDLELSWSSPGPCFRLESSPSLLPGSWTPVPPTRLTRIASSFILPITTTTAPAQFFRLTPDLEE